jgi:hypothetical protein
MSAAKSRIKMGGLLLTTIGILTVQGASLIVVGHAMAGDTDSNLMAEYREGYHAGQMQAAIDHQNGSDHESCPRDTPAYCYGYDAGYEAGSGN